MDRNTEQLELLDLQEPLLRRVKRGQESVQLVSLLPSPTPSRLSHRFSMWLAAWRFGAKKIDVLSRVMFPVCFALFNLMYWSYYLKQSQNHE